MAKNLDDIIIYKKTFLNQIQHKKQKNQNKLQIHSQQSKNQKICENEIEIEGKNCICCKSNFDKINTNNGQEQIQIDKKKTKNLVKYFQNNAINRENYKNIIKNYENQQKISISVKNQIKYIEILKLKACLFYGDERLAQDIQYDDSISHYLNAVFINPYFTKAYYNIGVCFLKKQQEERAIQIFQKCLKIDKNHCDSLYNLATIYLKKREFEQAKALYDDIDINVLDEDMLLQLADINFYLSLKIQKQIDQDSNTYWNFQNTIEKTQQWQNYQKQKKQEIQQEILKQNKIVKNLNKNQKVNKNLTIKNLTKNYDFQDQQHSVSTESSSQLSSIFSPHLKKKQKENQQFYNKIIQNLIKTKPVQLRQPHENLKDQNYQQQNKIQQIRNEKQGLKFQLQKVESQRDLYYNIIQVAEKEALNKLGYKIGNKSQYVLSLEKQIREQKINIYLAEQEIIKLQKNPHFTKQLEQDIENSVFQAQNEIIENELKKVFKKNESLAKQIDDHFFFKLKQKSQNQFQQQSNSKIDQERQKYYKKLQIKAIENQIKSQKIELIQIQEKQEEIQAKRDIQDEKNKSLVSEIRKYNIQLEDLEQTGANIQDTIQLYDQQQKYDEEEKIRAEKERKRILEEKKNKMLSFKELKIKELLEGEKLCEVQIERLQQLQNELNQSKNAVNSDMREKVLDLKAKKENLKRKYLIVNKLLKQEVQQEQSYEQNSLPQFSKGNQSGYFEISKNILKKKQIQPSKQKNKIPTLKSYDIKWIAQEVQFNLSLRGISLYQAYLALFPENIKKQGKISIKTLARKFREEPFAIQKKDKAILLARYLIESNNDDFIEEISLEATQSLKIVKSILKKVLGDIRPYKDFEYEKKYWDFWNEKVKEMGTPLQDIIQGSKVYKENGFVNPDQLEELINQIYYGDIKDFHYLIFRLYEISKDIQKLNLSKVFDIFINNSFQPLKYRFKLPQQKIYKSLLSQDSFDQNYVSNMDLIKESNGNDTERSVISKVNIDELIKEQQILNQIKNKNEKQEDNLQNQVPIQHALTLIQQQDRQNIKFNSLGTINFDVNQYQNQNSKEISKQHIQNKISKNQDKKIQNNKSRFSKKQTVQFQGKQYQIDDSTEEI
ncbi:hypothetical protein PPERSA_11232 [Pseudocohnilembus persalinus]|uniref:Uncharacterized protein n=1 Tax=Pseudocohnilembus persalinus TaxID=266149 RepID=A0A0V0QZE1_PSEPJ|nr:hypothetical protein PPERSA_11232 [Pseudocohnilembus persalinus]|eukprot:KRX07683.1 hypothetical protein PPERSA_11232 [Pseudocohnilembus persalinus]